MIRRECAQAPTSPDCRWHAHRLDAGRNLEHQFAARLVVQPYRAALGAEHLLRRRDHLSQHRHEVERRGERLGDVQDRFQVARRERAMAEDGARRFRRPGGVHLGAACGRQCSSAGRRKWEDSASARNGPPVGAAIYETIPRAPCEYWSLKTTPSWPPRSRARSTSRPTPSISSATAKPPTMRSPRRRTISSCSTSRCRGSTAWRYCAACATGARRHRC